MKTKDGMMRQSGYGLGQSRASLVGRVVLLTLTLVASVWLCAPFARAANIPSPPRYEQAKKELAVLYKDERRSTWREPWQKLADTFHDIYLKEKDWPNRPAALFRSALALDEMARRSFVRKDAQAALERYMQVADKHRTNPLADDALLAAAKLQAERMGDLPEAMQTVERLCSVYPKSDECREGRELIGQRTQDTNDAKAQTTGKAVLEQPAPQKKTEISRITALTWSTKGKVVRIELALDKPVAWELRSRGGNTKSGVTPALTLELHGTRPDASVTPGGKISGSSLKRVRLDYHKTNVTRLLLDYSHLERFSIREEDGGKKLVIETTMLPAELAGGLTPGNTIRSPRAAAEERRAQSGGDSSAFWVATHNLASQFGLNVRTVVIDAGHGGKDPGTQHNGILEREMTLDLALRLGKLLKAEGFDVKYTRTKDVWVSLNGRTEIANKHKADLFISLHVNASQNNAKKSGFETYYLDISSSTAAASLASFENMLSNRKLGDLEKMVSDLMLGARKDESMRLARDIQQKSINRLAKKGFAVHNGGIRGAPFVVLIGTNMPAVLVEVGYCTNKQEAKRMQSSAYRNALVQGVADGVMAYAERLRNTKKR